MTGDPRDTTMAGAGGTAPPTPLRLKDLLELDCDSCSAAGFRCYPRRLVCESSSASAPMRHLLESSPSLRLPRPSSKLSHLSRSLSRRLSRRGSFWSRRCDDDDKDAAADAAAASAGCRGSGICEELETSSSSESSDNSSGRTRRRSRSESDSVFSSATEASEDSVHHEPSQAARDEHEQVAMKRMVSKDGSSGSGSEADDKEQLSPVAIMDFPFDEDEDDELGDDDDVACYPSFSLARLQRRKTHKIRRFGSHADELTPLDLETRLATTSPEPDDGPAAAAVPAQAQQMIRSRTGDAATTPTCAGSFHHDVKDEDDNLISLLLMGTVSGGMDDATERLLLDFFVEMNSVGGVLRRKAERVVHGGDEAAVAAAARGWLDGTGTERWGLAEVLRGGAAIVAEMERGRRWMQFGEEEREVGTVVAGMLADQLVLEVVRCLFE